jgi:hypothetical protein
MPTAENAQGVRIWRTPMAKIEKVVARATGTWPGSQQRIGILLQPPSLDVPGEACRWMEYGENRTLL